MLRTGTVAGTGFALMLGLLASVGAHAQAVQRTKSARPPLERTADALGMERGIRRELTAINAISFTAKGTLTVGEQSVSATRAVYSMSYFVPAVRLDVTVDKSAARSIRVANGTLAWNESTPGVGEAAADTSAEERMRQVWLTPHGAIRAMVDARAKDPKAVTINTAGGVTTFTATLQGGPMEVTVNAEHRPERMRWTLGGKTYEAQFSDYKDWELLDVFFPKRIVQRIDGKVVADLTITDFRSNPYVVFPIPASLRPT